MVGLTAAGTRFATAAVPLLVQAKAARDAARIEPRRCTLRVGVPSGTGDFIHRVDVVGTARDVLAGCPDLRLVRVEVPFPALTRCLPENRVDILLTTHRSDIPRWIRFRWASRVSASGW